MRVEMPLPQPASGHFLTNGSYVLEVDGQGDGGVAGASQDFSLTESRGYVFARLGVNARSASLRIRWLGPLAGRPVANTGDGDDPIAAGSRAPVRDAIPFRVTLRTTGEVKAQGLKQPQEDETVVSAPAGVLQVGHEYQVQTEPVAGWAAATASLVVHSPTAVLEVYLDRVAAPTQHAALSSTDVAVSLRAPRGAPPWAASLPTPRDIGFVISTVGGLAGSGDDGAGAGGATVASGPLDVRGNGRFPAGALAPGTAYRCRLAVGRDGTNFVPIEEGARDGAVVAAQAQFIAPANRELALELHRVSRGVTASLRSSDGTTLPALEVHVSHAQALGRPLHTAVTDVASSCTVPGAAGMYVGEQYVLHVAATASTAETSHPFVVQPHAYGAAEGPMALSLEVPKPSAATRWADDLPPRIGAAEQAVANARRLKLALRGLWTDYKVVAEALGNRTASELQLLRGEYTRQHGRELGDDLRHRSSALKSKAAKLEQLLVRARPEIDAICVRAAVVRKTLSTEIYEVLCTSLPHSLQELQRAYAAMYNGADILADIRRLTAADGTPPGSAVGPLLAAMLEGAAHALSFSGAAQIEPDVTQLRFALGEHSAQPAAEALGAVIVLFSRRTREHLRAVVASYRRLTGSDLVAALKAKFGGDLLRALLLLLEPAEVYFARKLHGAFHGVKATSDLDKKDLLGSKQKLWDRFQTSRGLMTHDDTLVAVIATRFGRDLSAVSTAYLRLYAKSLPAELRFNTHGDLCRLLAATVEGAVALSRGAGASADGQSR